jgi:hypothetical protein
MEAAWCGSLKNLCLSVSICGFGPFDSSVRAPWVARTPMGYRPSFVIFVIFVVSSIRAWRPRHFGRFFGALGSGQIGNRRFGHKDHREHKEKPAVVGARLCSAIRKDHPFRRRFLTANER